MNMLARLGNLYAFLFGWPFLSAFHKAIFYLSARALGLHNYTSTRVSGELGAIKLGITGKSAPVVFDVGANEGHWLSGVLELASDARVHAFEPQTNLARRVAATHPSVTINNMALADEPGMLELCDYDDNPGSQHATLLKGVIDGVHQGTPRYTCVPVGTLDEYCYREGVDHIDLLKIDVEGFEMKVLQGAKRMLAEGRIDVIQFEFNEMNVVARTFFNDFASCLDTHRLYRLLPHGLLPLSTGRHWINEQFIFQNVIALRTR